MKKGYILLSVICLAFLSINAFADDGEKDEEKDVETYEFKVKNIESSTKIIITCDNGYNEKEEIDEEKESLKFDLPKDTECTLVVKIEEPCNKTIKVILNDDEIDLEDFYDKDCGTTEPPPGTAGYMLTAWNDLGMHCMDGNDYSVFSVLPPYNNLHAQIKDKNGDLITSGITMTYESAIGTDGQINTTSVKTTNGMMKTNFWDYVTDLFGTTPDPDVGLTGHPMSSTTPSLMVFNTTHQWRKNERYQEINTTRNKWPYVPA